MDFSSNSQTTTNGGFHLLEIHWGTAGLQFGLFAVIAIIAYVIWRRYKAKARRFLGLPRHQDTSAAIAMRALEWAAHPGPFNAAGAPIYPPRGLGGSHPSTHGLGCNCPQCAATPSASA